MTPRAAASEIEVPTPEEARLHPMLWAIYAAAHSDTHGAWRPAAHLWLLADLLVQVHQRKIKRLCVSMPPQHGKSWLVSRFFPTWWLGLDPKAKVIEVSYSQDLTLENTGACRDLVIESGPDVFGISAWHRAKKSQWDVYHNGFRSGGSMRGIGVKGGATGRRGDVVIVDDPIKDKEDADNPKMRQKVVDWCRAVALTRIPDSGAAIVVATRWHEKDLIGTLEEAQRNGEIGEPWTFVNIPALAEPGRADPLGRKAGEGLWPAQYPGDWYEKKQREVGAYTWSALYQGRPTPVDGAIFRRPHFRYYQRRSGAVDFEGRVYALSAMLKFSTIDLAVSKKETGCFTVFSAWGITDGFLFLLDRKRARMDGPEIIPTAQAQVDDWDLSLAFFEDAGFQLTMIQTAVRAGLPARGYKVKGDKVARARGATPWFEQGRVAFPADAPWLPELASELLQFPNGEHDDQVDTVSMAVDIFARRARARTAQGRGKRAAEPDPLEGRGGF